MSRTPVQRAVYAARMIRRGSDLPVEPHVLAVERGPSLKHEHVREFTRAVR